MEHPARRCGFDDSFVISKEQRHATSLTANDTA
jgi:hypothetical protein